MKYSGPYGEQDDEQVFVQKVVSETDKLFIRYASTGKRFVFKHSLPSFSVFYIGLNFINNL